MNSDLINPRLIIPDYRQSHACSLKWKYRICNHFYIFILATLKLPQPGLSGLYPANYTIVK